MAHGKKPAVVGGNLHVHLTHDDVRKFVENATKEIGKHQLDHLITHDLRNKVFVNVRGYKNVAPYTRAMPGKAGLAKVIGKEAFEGAGVLIGVAFQAIEDAQDDTLTGPQRLGRASVAILEGVVAVECPPIGLILLGLAIVRPDLKDQATRWLFSDQNPVVRSLADVIDHVGGDGFQQWSLRYGSIDIFLSGSSR